MLSLARSTAGQHPGSSERPIAGGCGDPRSSSARASHVQQLLEYVNEQEDTRQLMRGVVTDLLVFGDSFTEVVYLNGKPIALYPLDPRTLSTS